MKVWPVLVGPTLALLGALAGCAVPELRPIVTMRGMPAHPVSTSELERNNAIFRGQFKEEPKANTDTTSQDVLDRWKSLQSFKREQEWYGPSPNLCLALSGGGVRSGTFGVGVLHGLSKAGFLDKVKIISAVSGGAYAASALYAQYHHMRSENPNISVNELINEDYVAELMNRGRVFKEHEWFGLADNTLGYLPLNLYENGVFARHTNTATIADEYRRRLMWAFHGKPKSKAWDEKGERLIPLKEISLAEFDLATSRKANLPLLVLNATSQYHKAANTGSHVLAEKVFEFTPLAYGSDALGRYALANVTIPESVSLDNLRVASYSAFPLLSWATAISGAAVDLAPIAGDFLRVPLSTLNFDLGWFIRNPTIKAGQETEAYERKHFPAYFSDRLFYNDISGLAWYVTDGGHSENLGLFTLIRRGCQKIIVVDAEQDAAYEFEGYFNLQKALLAPRSLNVAINIPEIDRVAATHAHATNALSKSALVSSIQKQWATEPFQLGTVGLFPVPKDNQETPPTNWVHQFDWRALQIAYIKPAHTPMSDEDCKKVLQIKKYFRGDKVMLDPSIVEEDPEILAAEKLDPVKFYYCHIKTENKKIWRQLRGLTDFPQQVTSDLNYSPLQVQAYVCLGFRTINALLEKLYSKSVAGKECPGAGFEPRKRWEVLLDESQARRANQPHNR